MKLSRMHQIAGIAALTGLMGMEPTPAQVAVPAPQRIDRCDAATIQSALNRGGDYQIVCTGNIGPRLQSGMPVAFLVPAGKQVRLSNASGGVVRLTASGNGDCVRTLRVKGTLTLEGVDIRGGSSCGAAGGFGAAGSSGADGAPGARGGDHLTRDGDAGAAGAAGQAGGHGLAGGNACGGGVYVDSSGVLNLLRVEVSGNRVTGGNGGGGGNGGRGGRGGSGGHGSYTYTRAEGAPGNGGAGAAGGDGAAGGNGGRGGMALGGGICNYGTLNVSDSRFVANTVQAGSGMLGGAGGSAGAGGDGGWGGFNTVTSSCEPDTPQIRGGNGALAGNGGKGGAAGKAGIGGEARGAAIYSEGPLSISNTVFQANTASGGAGAQGQNGGDGGAGGLGGSGERGFPEGSGAAGGNGGDGGARSSGGKGGNAFGAAIATANGGGAQLAQLSFQDNAVQPGVGGLAGNRQGAGGLAGAGGNDAHHCSPGVSTKPAGVPGRTASFQAKPGASGLTGAPELDLR